MNEKEFFNKLVECRDNHSVVKIFLEKENSLSKEDVVLLLKNNQECLKVVSSKNNISDSRYLDSISLTITRLKEEENLIKNKLLSFDGEETLGSLVSLLKTVEIRKEELAQWDYFLNSQNEKEPYSFGILSFLGLILILGFGIGIYKKYVKSKI